MYENFFGFREKPFSLLPDPAFLYFGRQHSTAYSLLEYGVLNQAGFTVVTGDVGCGKTTLIRHLLGRLDTEINVGLLSNTHPDIKDLLRWVLMVFGLDYESKGPVELYEAFVEFLIAEYRRRHRVVLIVDEAQNLDAAALEELRTLSNINADNHLILQLILVGQPELRNALERPELRQLAQRVVAHYHLTALSEVETTAYIRHRLEHAGGSADMFTADACLRVYGHTGGVPRLINLLCDTSLVYAFGEGVRKISAEIVCNVIAERAAGMFPQEGRGVPASTQPASPPPTPPGTTQADQEEAAGKRAPGPRLDRAQARQLFSHLTKNDS